VAFVGEPGRRTGLSAAERVANDAGGRGRSVQSPEARAGVERIHAND